MMMNMIRNYFLGVRQILLLSSWDVFGRGLGLGVPWKIPLLFSAALNYYILDPGKKGS